MEGVKLLIDLRSLLVGDGRKLGIVEMGVIER
jgi:hypothetical protein